MREKIFSFILPFFFVALISVTALTGCNGTGTSSPEIPPPIVVNAIDIGEGGNVFRFEVTDNENNVSAWNVSTDETTVGAALSAVGLIEGDVSAMGMLVTTVNGITADFIADGSWWTFYVDGGMAPVGVDATNVEAGRTYAFVYTTG